MAMQQRAIETRERIVAAAAEIFSKMSFAEASMSDIIKLAAVTQGSVYFHFDSKMDLAKEIVHRQHLISMELGKNRLESQRPAIDSMVDLSFDLARSLLSQPIMRAGLRLSTESLAVFDQPIEKPYLDWMEFCTTLLERAADEGELIADQDIESISFVIISSFTGAHVFAAALGELDTLESRLSSMWRLLLPSIVTDKAKTPILSAH
jgi:AcrR family transcriptional regulator